MSTVHVADQSDKIKLIVEGWVIMSTVHVADQFDKFRFPFRALSKFHSYFDILHKHVSTACYDVLRRLCNNLNI